MIAYPSVTPRNIWNFRQNNPELVVEDARLYLGLDDIQAQTLRTILLARGVNKWLKVRRDLVAYKCLLKVKIRRTQLDIVTAKARGDGREVGLLRERLKTLAGVRGALRQLCHSDRYVVWPVSTSRSTVRKMNTIRVGEEMN